MNAESDFKKSKTSLCTINSQNVAALH